MSWSRRSAALLVVAGLVLPQGPAVAQDLLDGWTTIDDGLVVATNDTFDATPAWQELRPNQFPAAIAGIPGPERLHRVSGTLDTGTRVGRLLDTEELPWLAEGRTPLLATAIVDGDGASWAKWQHIVATPRDCPTGRPDCLTKELFVALADLAAPNGTPVGPIFGEAEFEPEAVATTAVVQRDGTLFSFGGDASVGTTVRFREDGRVVVLGEAEIGDAVGGRLRGHDVFIVDGSEAAPIRLPRSLGSVAQRARAVREAGARVNGTNRHVFECPDSGAGYAVSQFLVNGLGRNVGPTVDPALDGGTAVLVTDIVFFECPGAGRTAALPADGRPAAAFVCGSTRAQHRPFTSIQGGRQKTSNSSLAQQLAMITHGIAPGAAASATVRIGGANGGEIYSVDLEGIPLDSAADSDIVLWLGQSEVGIDTYGPKSYRRLELTADGTTFDLLDQQRGAVGDAFEVGPSQRPRTNCPGFEFRPQDVPTIFPDGFESGDVSAWSYSRAD